MPTTKKNNIIDDRNCGILMYDVKLLDKMANNTFLELRQLSAKTADDGFIKRLERSVDNAELRPKLYGFIPE